MMASTVDVDSRARAQSRVRWELLTGLVRKDLKVKYQGSVLGFLWSLANPLMLLVVYTFVFQVVLRSGIPQFGYFLLSGLLIWNAFVGAVSFACEAVVGNAGLVKKVRFPLNVLPMTSVGFQLIHFALQLLVLVVVLLITGHTSFIGFHLLLVIPAIAVAVILTVGLAYLVAALNVRYRDTKHIVEIVLMAGFWANPIVYSVGLVSASHTFRTHSWLTDLYYLNPMAGVVTAMQRALYADNITIHGTSTTYQVLADPGYLFYVMHLGEGAAVSLVILWFGLRIFDRMSADFAEEL